MKNQPMSDCLESVDVTDMSKISWMKFESGEFTDMDGVLSPPRIVNALG